MAKILSRSPTPQEEHAYYEWARQFLWNDHRCDYCERLLDEDNVHEHDVWKDGQNVPKRVYCSTTCYAMDRNQAMIERGEV